MGAVDGTAKDWSRRAGGRRAVGVWGDKGRMYIFISKVQKTPETRHLFRVLYKRTLNITFRVRTNPELVFHREFLEAFACSHSLYRNKSDFVIFIGAALPLFIQHCKLCMHLSSPSNSSSYSLSAVSGSVPCLARDGHEPGTRGLAWHNLSFYHQGCRRDLRQK